MIIGAPIAGWAVFACLTLAGLNFIPAGVIGILWTVLWFVVAHLTRPVRSQRGNRTSRTSEGASRRRSFNLAIFVSTLAPVAVFLLTKLLVSIVIMPVSIALPLAATLSAPGPVLLWLLAIRRRVAPKDEPIMAMDWKQYETSAHPDLLPPRRSSAIRMEAMRSDRSDRLE